MGIRQSSHQLLEQLCSDDDQARPLQNSVVMMIRGTSGWPILGVSNGWFLKIQPWCRKFWKGQALVHAKGEGLDFDLPFSFSAKILW